MLVEERVDKGEKKREGEGDKGARMVRRHRVTEDQPGWFSPPRAFRALCRWPDSRKDLICCSVLYISFGILSSPFLFFSFHPSPLNRCFGPTREKSSRDVGNKSACFYENGLGVCHRRSTYVYVYIYIILYTCTCVRACVCVGSTPIVPLVLSFDTRARLFSFLLLSEKSDRENRDKTRRMKRCRFFFFPFSRLKTRRKFRTIDDKISSLRFFGNKNRELRVFPVRFISIRDTIGYEERKKNRIAKTEKMEDGKRRRTRRGIQRIRSEVNKILARVGVRGAKLCVARVWKRACACLCREEKRRRRRGKGGAKKRKRGGGGGGGKV